MSAVTRSGKKAAVAMAGWDGRAIRGGVAERKNPQVGNEGRAEQALFPTMRAELDRTLRARHRHDLDDVDPSAGHHLQMGVVLAENLGGRVVRFGLDN